MRSRARTMGQGYPLLDPVRGLIHQSIPLPFDWRPETLSQTFPPKAIFFFLFSESMLVHIVAPHGSCLGVLAIDTSKWELRPRQLHKFCGTRWGLEVVRLHLAVFFQSTHWLALSDQLVGKGRARKDSPPPVKSLLAAVYS